MDQSITSMSRFIHPNGRMGDDEVWSSKDDVGSLESLLYALTMKDETSRSRERIDERIKS